MCVCDDFCWEGGRRGQLYRNAQTNPDQLRFPVSVHSAKTPRHFSHHFPLITNGKRRQLHFFIFPGISKHQHQSQEGQVKFPQPQTPLAPQTHRDFSRSSSSRRCAFAERKKGEIRTFHYTTHRKRVARRSTVPGTVRLNPFFGP